MAGPGGLQGVGAPPLPVGPAGAAVQRPLGADAFAAELAQAVQRAGGAPPTADLRLSGHAAERLAQAGVHPGAQDWADVGRAVGRAAAKGSRQALVLWDRCALVVAVPERTVVTAVARERMADHVFTGIDSAVFVTRT